MRADFKIVLDACVLANYSVCDLFLNLAERPRLYLPRWSENILEEVSGVQLKKLDWPERLVDSFRMALTENFPEASVDNFDTLDNKRFVITNQYAVKALETKIPDIVLLINGIPIVVDEARTPRSPAPSTPHFFSRLTSTLNLM